ncbi:MAG: hypothetical protein RL354_1422, partial [Planctomycetota bacterium]
ADARCPECGGEILATLALRLDPATESLERSPELMRTCWAIYLMSLGSVLGCAIALAPLVDLLLDELTFPRWLSPGIAGVRALAPSVALAGTVIGLAAAVFVMPWRRDRAFVRARGAGGGGFLGWLVLALQPPSWLAALLAVAAIAAVAASTTPLLRRLVPHARLFRTARHATQTTRDLLIASAVTGCAGGTTLWLSSEDPTAGQAVLLSGAVAWSSGLLLAVGLAYRLVNAQWILRSLRRPPPKVDEVLAD